MILLIFLYCSDMEKKFGKVFRDVGYRIAHISK